MSFDDEQIAFYFEIGRTVTQWGNVERALWAVAGSCIPTLDFNVLCVGFFAIENFRSKLSFTEAPLTVNVSDEQHLGDWGKLRGRAERASVFRNRLAHEPVLDFPNAPSGRRIAVLRPILRDATALPEKPPSDALCLRDIAEIRLNALATFVALENLASRISGQPEKLPKSAEQPKSPPTIRQLDAQIRAIQGRQPRPSLK